MDGLMAMSLFLQAAENGEDLSWPTAVIPVMGILMVTVIATVAVWQGLGTWRARMQIAREQAYQKLAEEMASSQKTAAAELQRMANDLADLRARTEEVERMLKEV